MQLVMKTADTVFSPRFRAEDRRGHPPRRSARIPWSSPRISGWPMPDLSYLPQVAVSGVAVGCIYGLIGIGFCVIYNASGIVNFAQGAFVMMGGMISYSGLKTLGLPLPLAAIIAIALTAAAGRRDREDRGSAAMGPQGHDVRHDPGHARGADRGRAAGADRRGGTSRRRCHRSLTCRHSGSAPSRSVISFSGSSACLLS